MPTTDETDARPAAPFEAPPGARPGDPDWLLPADLEAARRALGPRPERCLLCDDPRQRELFRADGKAFWLCERCELVYVHDIYPEFVTRPPERSMHEGLVRTPARRRRKYAAWLRELEPFRASPIGGRLLDVGCGQGEFLDQAREAGWDVRGVDVDPVRVQLAREGRGLDVFQGELAEAGFDEGTFDVVFMSEVIEHVVDPVPLMQQTCRVLRPGGAAVLRTGNARSWSARLRGADWDYYRFGYHAHIRYFGPRSARVLAERAGFADVGVRTQGFALRESAELQGRWYKLPVKLAQGLLSPVAGPLGAGHRLVMTFLR